LDAQLTKMYLDHCAVPIQVAIYFQMINTTIFLQLQQTVLNASE